MAKPTSIDGGAPSLVTQNATHTELIVNDVEQAKINQSAVLSLTEDRTAQFPRGVTSIDIHEMEAPGVEDTKEDGSEQSDLSGGATPQTLTFDQYKTVPGYFYYKHSEAATLSYQEAFLDSAPKVALQNITDSVIASLRSIGATNYRQLSGTDIQGNANSALDATDINAGKDIIRAAKLDMSQAYGLSDEGQEEDLPVMFDLYNSNATSQLGDLAKLSGSLGVALGLPMFIERTPAMVSGVITAQSFIFHKTAVSWAIRTVFELDQEEQKSKARTYWGVRFSYGVNVRSGARGLVLQNTAAFTA
jgi:hypothetical protein